MHTGAIESTMSRSIASTSTENIRDTFFFDRRSYNIFAACFSVVLVLVSIVVAILHTALDAAAPWTVAGDKRAARTTVACVKTQTSGTAGGLAGFGYAALDTGTAGTVTGHVETVGNA